MARIQYSGATVGCSNNMSCSAYYLATVTVGDTIVYKAYVQNWELPEGRDIKPIQRSFMGNGCWVWQIPHTGGQLINADGQDSIMRVEYTEMNT